jgi:hypothetical protein
MAPAPSAAPTDGIVRVWINRTQTPIEAYEGIIPACARVAFTEADLAAAGELRRLDRFPPSPPGAVDLTLQAYSTDGSQPLPFIIVELPDGIEKYFFGGVDDTQLPPCAGRAAPGPAPTYVIAD